MKIEELLGCPVIDGHIHYPHYSLRPSLLEVADQLRIDRLNIVCTPEQERLSLVPDALHLKAHHPERVYVFGGLDISAYFRAPHEIGTVFSENVRQLLAAGCDGIKMIEGKPMMRKDLPIPAFDSELFAPYWETLEEIQAPVVFHINDPEEFWDRDKAPAWAFERGWFYGGGDYIDNEAQYAEIRNVLDRHPNLKIIFAHFLFFSAQLPRLAEYLDQFPNLYVDLTPGIEMYHNFTRDIQAAYDFFIKYQDRIIFGTDIGAKALLADLEGGVQLDESQTRVLLIRNFLENEGGFQIDPGTGFLFDPPDFTFEGINLPQDVLEKIYYKNFQKAAGAQPKPLNPPGIIEMCGQIEIMLQFLMATQPDRNHDLSVAKAVKEFFETQLINH